MLKLRAYSSGLATRVRGLGQVQAMTVALRSALASGSAAPLRLADGAPFTELQEAINELLEGASGARDSGAGRVQRVLSARGPADSASPAAAPPEIRTLLEGLAALAARLQTEELADEHARLAAVIARASVVVNRLAERSDTHGPHPAKGGMDLAQVVEDAVDILWGAARARGIDLAAFVDPATPALVDGRPLEALVAVSAAVALAMEAGPIQAVMVQAGPKGDGLRVAVRAVFRAGASTSDQPFGHSDEFKVWTGRCTRLASAAGGQASCAEGGAGYAIVIDLAASEAAPPAPWPNLHGATAVAELGPDATRSALHRYLRAAGMRPPEDGGQSKAALVISDPPRLQNAARAPGQVVCVGPRAESRSVVESGLADLALGAPLRRAQVRAVLERLAAGRPVAETARRPAAPAIKESMPAIQPASSQAELLDPQVTAELARLAAAGKGEFVKRVRRLYRQIAPEAVKAVIDKATSGDCLGVAEAAHQLKSMSLNMGARVVAETAGRIEAQARGLAVVNVDQAQILHRQLLATLDVLEGYPPVLHPPGAAEGDPDDQSLLADLQAAIAGDQLSLAYQPQFDRDGETITGIETLVRWTHPERGFVSPAFFIPIAERYGVIGDVTRWVLARAMRETRDLGDFNIAFNASALEFGDPAFVDELAVLIARCGFDPRRLEIEVTETAVLAEEDGVRRNMTRLHDLGLKIALDDFGVGYSSLSHLRLFPFDKLKIDRAFVTGCPDNLQSAALVNAVISIGRALGMKVVAEGVETEAQRRFLSAAGVHAMQGYLFARPEPIEALKARLAAEPAPNVAAAAG